jgi:hypothetical protein
VSSSMCLQEGKTYRCQWPHRDGWRSNVMGVVAALTFPCSFLKQVMCQYGYKKLNIENHLKMKMDCRRLENKRRDREMRSEDVGPGKYMLRRVFSRGLCAVQIYTR